MKLGKVGYLVVFFHFMNGDFFDTSCVPRGPFSTPRAEARKIHYYQPTGDSETLFRHKERKSTFEIVNESIIPRVITEKALEMRLVTKASFFNALYYIVALVSDTPDIVLSVEYFMCSTICLHDGLGIKILKNNDHNHRYSINSTSMTSVITKSHTQLHVEGLHFLIDFDRRRPEEGLSPLSFHYNMHPFE